MAYRERAKSKNNLNLAISSRILSQLEHTQIAPWREPIDRLRHFGGIPVNYESGLHYRGINILLLAMSAWKHGYKTNAWGTEKQIKAMGGAPRNGERPTLAVRNAEQICGSQADASQLPPLKGAWLYNIEQCDGTAVKRNEDAEANWNTASSLCAAQKIVEDFTNGPRIKHQHIPGFVEYIPVYDLVRIEKQERYKSTPLYFTALFNGLVRSTGHFTRLDFDHRLFRGMPRPDVESFCREDLIAELGSAFLTAATGLDIVTSRGLPTSRYLDGWQKAIRNDYSLPIEAADIAQQSVDFILGNGRGKLQSSPAISIP